MGVNTRLCASLLLNSHRMKLSRQGRPEEKETQKNACAVHAAGLPNHEASYTSYTANYWYEPFINLLVS